MTASSFATTNTLAKAKLVFVFAGVSCFSAIRKTAAMPDPSLFPLGRGLLLFLALGEFPIAAIGRPTKGHVLNGRKGTFICYC
jgi:hypothetical protein